MNLFCSQKDLHYYLFRQFLSCCILVTDTVLRIVDPCQCQSIYHVHISSCNHLTTTPLPATKWTRAIFLLLFYFKLELPKERHFAILFITTHSVLLILIISKHYRQITYSVRYSKYLFLVYPRNEFFFNEIFAISGNENR